MCQHIITGSGRYVTERCVLELHLAAGFGQGGTMGILAIPDIGHGVKDLIDTLGAGLRAGELQQTHGQHHNAHQNLRNIGNEGGQVAHQHISHDDLITAQPQNCHDGGVQTDGHDGGHHNDPGGGTQSRIRQLVVALFELGFFIGRAHEGLDHADGHQVFLHRCVQVVDLLLHDAEQLMADRHQCTDGGSHQRNDNKQNRGQTGVDVHTDDQGRYQHDRSAHQHTQSHAHHVLHGVHVIGHARDQTGRGEAVDIRKGELLNFVKQALAQIGAETHTCRRSKLRGRYAGKHRQAGQNHHQSPHF